MNTNNKEGRQVVEKVIRKRVPALCMPFSVSLTVKCAGEQTTQHKFILG
jgi:hypothetical protein